MGERFPSRGGDESKFTALAADDDAAAVYPDYDVVTRHFDGPLTIGDFVSASADGAEVHGGLPTYLRLTVRGDAKTLRMLMSGRRSHARVGKRTSH
jgi:hypothetical protein